MIHCALGNNYSSNSLTVIRSLVKNPTLRLLTAEFEVSVVSTSPDGETWVYEQGPLRGQAHSFHSSGWGWNIEPPAWDKMSLLTESSRGGPSRRDIISGNHTLPGHRGAMRSSRTWSRQTLSRTPGSRAVGEKPWPSLYHRVRSERSWMREGEPEWTVRRLSRPKQIHLCLTKLPPYQLHHLGWNLHSLGLSPCLDRMSAPIFWTPGM